MTNTQGTALAGITGWTQEFIDKLHEGWITSAEQVAELAATAQGLSALSEHLGISARHARRLVDAACLRLDLDTVAASKRRAAARKRPRAVPPEKIS